MKEKKINYCLKKLSLYELNAFKKYLLSPYFNQNDIFIQYFEVLDHALRIGEDINAIEDTTLWKAMYPNDAYNDDRFRKVVSQFFKLFEDFIAQVAFEADKSRQLDFKLQAYKQRELKELYPTAIGQIDSYIRTQQDKGAEYYLNRYNVERNVLDFHSQDDHLKSKKVDLTTKLNFGEISLNLDVFFISEKLKYYYNFLSWNRSYKLDQKIVGIEIILKLAQSPIFREYPSISIYFNLIKTITEENNIENFEKVKSQILKHLYAFDEEEQFELFRSLLSFSITKANKGVSQFESVAFELYKIGIENNVLVKNKNLLSTTYRNIVFYGIKLKEYDWVEDFIHDYAPYLKAENREAAVNFSLARLETSRKNWGKVIEYLAFIEYKEAFEALLSRSILLVAYYELNELDSLESLLNSFKKYVERDKTYNDNVKLGYFNLIKFTRQLIKMAVSDKLKLEKLKVQITETERLVNKAWLIEKVEEKIKKPVRSLR